jgi:hypothetical protein
MVQMVVDGWYCIVSSVVHALSRLVVVVQDCLGRGAVVKIASEGKCLECSGKQFAYCLSTAWWPRVTICC